MKILFVGEVASIHTARWINQFDDTGWDIHIFQGLARYGSINPKLRAGTIYLPFLEGIIAPSGVKVERTLTPNPAALIAQAFQLPQKSLQWLHVLYLARLIAYLQPDVIHSLGLNINWKNMCLPVLQARMLLGGRFESPWIYSSWGADLVHYPTLSPDHRREVGSIMAAIDYHISECQRDERLAREMGFQGEVLGHLPVFGGVEWNEFHALRQQWPVSQRKIIVLKGRDQADKDPQGRALTAMKAFELCADVLRTYEIIILQAGPEVKKAALELSRSQGLKITVSSDMPFSDCLRVMGRSRIMLAVTVTDGLPGMLVEAMAMGAFPIHSNLEPIREWIHHGENGFLIPPDDPQTIAAALRKALSDDELVNKAAALNEQIVQARLVDTVVRSQAITMYERAVGKGCISQVSGRGEDEAEQEKAKNYYMLKADLENWECELKEQEQARNQFETNLNYINQRLLSGWLRIVRKGMEVVFWLMRRLEANNTSNTEMGSRPAVLSGELESKIMELHQCETALNLRTFELRIVSRKGLSLILVTGIKSFQWGFRNVRCGLWRKRPEQLDARK